MGKVSITNQLTQTEFERLFNTRDKFMTTLKNLDFDIMSSYIFNVKLSLKYFALMT